MSERWYTTAQAARRLFTTREYVRRLIKEGWFPAAKRDKKKRQWLIRETDLVAMEGVLNAPKCPWCQKRIIADFIELSNAKFHPEPCAEEFSNALAVEKLLAGNRPNRLGNFPSRGIRSAART